MTENLSIFYDDKWHDIDDIISFDITYRTQYDCISPFHYVPGDIDKVHVKMHDEIIFSFSLYTIITIGSEHEISKYYKFIVYNLANILNTQLETITQCCYIR